MFIEKMEEQQERIVKGIWIPIEIWKDKNLTWNEKILFLEIDSYTSKDKDCYFSNEYISELLGISLTNASKTISSLIEKGYIIKTKFDGRKRYIKSALSYSTSQTCQERQPSHVCAYNVNTSTMNDDLINKDNKKEKTKEEIKELKEKFTNFVSLYKKAGGRVRGVDTEFNDFIKRHKDWKLVIPYLEIAIKRETKARNQARLEKRFFPEMKNLQTYLGKQRAWELYVVIGEDIQDNKYEPQGRTIWFNEETKSYWSTYNFYDERIYDGYDDDNRPDGAEITLNNARGTYKWNSNSKKWEKK